MARIEIHGHLFLKNDRFDMHAQRAARNVGTCVSPESGLLPHESRYYYRQVDSGQQNSAAPVHACKGTLGGSRGQLIPMIPKSLASGHSRRNRSRAAVDRMLAFAVRVPSPAIRIEPQRVTRCT